LFNADVAESVLHLFEDKHPENNKPRKLIEGIRLFHAGKITGDELNELKSAVYYTICEVDGAVYYAADAAYYASNKADNTIAFDTTYAASHAIDYNVAYTIPIDARKKRWDDIEVILRKYLN